jgi:hypothetical protein
MWESEAQFRDFIKQKLEEMGHSVKSEVRIYKRMRVDLISEREEPAFSPIAGTKKKVVRAIEAKLYNKGKIYDAISRCMNLSYLPRMDEVYVAFPEFFFQKAIREYLQNIPVGAIIVKPDGIQIIPPAWNRKPPSLLGGGSYPNNVSPGEEFEIKVDAGNVGGKVAVNVVLEWTPAGPFRRPKGEKNRKVIAELEPSQHVSMPFKIKVRPKTPLGKYPLLTKISADGLDARTSFYEMEVKEIKHFTL